MQQPETQTTEVALDIGSWVSGPSYEVPQPRCAKCEDWTTLVVLNVEFPCPVCRPAEFQAWHAAAGRAPSTGPATA